MNKVLYTVIVASLALVFTMFGIFIAIEDPPSPGTSLMRVSVQIRSGANIGSGTVIGHCHEYIPVRLDGIPLWNRDVITCSILATAAHVVRGEETAAVEWYGSGDHSKEVMLGKVRYQDPDKDLALVEVSANLPAAARYEGDGNIAGEDAWTVGSQAGEPPLPSAGIAGIVNENYGLRPSSTPIYFGSSGGGLFIYDKRRRCYPLVGVIIGMRTASDPSEDEKIIPTIALARPIQTLREFLKEHAAELRNTDLF